jgi:hypothetical protein
MLMISAPLLHGPGKPFEEGPHGRVADEDAGDEEAGRRRDANRDALGSLPARDRAADMGAVPPGVEGRAHLDPSSQRVDQDELLDPAGQRGVVAMDAGVEDRDVDVLAPGGLPHLRDTELLEAPGQPVLGLLAGELRVLNLLRPDQEALLH